MKGDIIMTRQRIRKLLIIISLLLFPVTLYYFSPALIINAGLHGIINGSFIVFLFLFLFSIPFGRLFCAYFCPAGGLQECAFIVNEKVPKQGWRNGVKFIIWGIWLTVVVFCYFSSGKIVAVDFFFETENGISVSNIQSYIIYYGIISLILISCGRCSKVCPMGIDVISETRNKTISNPECIQCGACIDNCPKNVLTYGMLERKESSNGE